MFDLSVLLGKAFESVSARPEIVIILVVALLAPLIKLFFKPKKKPQKSPPPPNKVQDVKPSFDARDHDQQMNAVLQVNFQLKPILNKEEYRLLPILDEIIEYLGTDYRLIMQASMGEPITPSARTAEAKERARRSVNSKRLDFAIIDRAGLLQLAIEYQGSGHYQKNAFARDAVKREALRRAGVHMLEIHQDHTAQKIRADVLAHFPNIQSAPVATEIKPRQPSFSQRASG